MKILSLKCNSYRVFDGEQQSSDASVRVSVVSDDAVVPVMRPEVAMRSHAAHLAYNYRQTSLHVF